MWKALKALLRGENRAGHKGRRRVVCVQRDAVQIILL